MSDRELVILTEVESEPLTWLWPDRIPQKGVTLLEGDPGDGKSTLMYDLIARVTTGRPMPLTTETASPAGVVLLQAEDLLREVVRPGLDAAGADVSRVVAYDRTRFSTKPLILSEDIKLLEDAIDSVGAKLVVIDPFNAFSGHSGNSESAVRRTLGALAALAEEKNVAIVVVRHMDKRRGSNPKHGGLGSTGFVAAARSVLVVVSDPNSTSPYQHILATSKSNLADASPLSYRTVKTDGVITVEWIGEVSQSLSEIFETGANRYEYSQLEEACFVLYSTLAEHGEPMPANEVKKKASEALVSERTLKRAKQKLRVTSRRRQIWDEEQESEVVKWIWELPKNDEHLKPYKERATREHVENLIESIDDDPATVPCEAEPDAEVVPTISSPSCDDSGAEDSSDWEPSDRPWDD